MNIKNRPLVRWAGSKTRMLPVLMEYKPKSYSRYIEPFCGSMSLFLRLRPASSLMGDINGDLINFYNQVKHEPKNISEAIHALPRTKEEYYIQRSLDCSSLDEFGRAVRFFFLNRHCFNGVYRTNRSGGFNVPYGSKLPEVPSEEEILAFSKKIRNTEFFSSDFEVTVEHAQENDFLYLDPPYAGTETKDRGEYGPNSFKSVDINRLGKTLRAASDNGVKILLSYASIATIKEEFSDWNISEVFVERSVSGFAHSRRKVPEVIITNY